MPGEQLPPLVHNFSNPRRITTDVAVSIAAMLAFSDPNQVAEVRQAAVYGLGAAAVGCKAAFAGIVPSK